MQRSKGPPVFFAADYVFDETMRNNALLHPSILAAVGNEKASIFVAFILEAFFVEYSLEKSEVETAIEKKIQELDMAVQEEDLNSGNLVNNMENCENGVGYFGDTSPKGLMFRIASNRYRTVDALLQRMFEAEMPLEEEVPQMDEILHLSPNDVYIHNPNFNGAA